MYAGCAEVEATGSTSSLIAVDMSISQSKSVCKCTDPKSLNDSVPSVCATRISRSKKCIDQINALQVHAVGLIFLFTCFF